MLHKSNLFPALALATILASAGPAVAEESEAAAALTQERVVELYFDAARQGRVDILDGLIRAGMDPNARDPRGFTPLIVAAYNGQAQPSIF